MKIVGTDGSQAEFSAGPLSSREKQVLGLVAKGLSYKQIAQHLGLSENTVNNHLRNARVKLRAANSIEAIVKAHIWTAE